MAIAGGGVAWGSDGAKKGLDGVSQRGNGYNGGTQQDLIRWTAVHGNK